MERQLAASSFGFAWALAEPSPMFVGAQLAPGQDVERAKSELLATVERASESNILLAEEYLARRQVGDSGEAAAAPPAAGGAL